MPDEKNTYSRIDRQSGTILVVEQDPMMLTAISAILTQQGHRVSMAKSNQVADDLINSGELDLLILSTSDVESGCQLAAKLRKISTTEQLPILFIVPSLAEAEREQLSLHGGVNCLISPFQPDSLLDLVERALWLPHIARSHGQSATPTSEHFRDWTTL